MAQVEAVGLNEDEMALFPCFFLFLVIIIIGALCYEMTSLTTFEAGALSPCFILRGVLFASFECGLEAFDDECHLIFKCFKTALKGRKEYPQQE